MCVAPHARMHEHRSQCASIAFVVQILLFADIARAAESEPLAFDAPVGSPALGTVPPEASPHADAPPPPPPPPAPPPVTRATPESNPWKFGYHGYLRAP